MAGSALAASGLGERALAEARQRRETRGDEGEKWDLDSVH